MTLLAISADSHVTEPGDCYVDHIDPKFRDRAPVAVTDDTCGACIDVDNGRSRIPLGMVAGAGRSWDQIHPQNYVGWDDLHQGGMYPELRLADQDRDGIAAEVLYPSVGMLLCNHPDVDYKKACFDAYNRWMAQFQSTAPDRLIGLGQTALRTVDEGVADFHDIARLGLRGVMMPGFAGCHDEGDYDDPRWNPLWEAAIELGFPLSFHILTAGAGFDGFRGPKMNGGMGIIRACQDIIGTFIFGGVFERYPELKVVCVEADAGWAPHWAYRADHNYDRHRNWLTAPISRRPSEYFFDNIYLTFQDDWIAFRTRHLMNHRRLCWASDFPHSDATYPNSQQMLAEQTADMTDDERDDILWRNTAGLYGIRVGARAV